MKTHQINSDVQLLGVYHTWFLFTHFKWLQLGDTKIGGKKSEYLNRHIIVRYFKMNENLHAAIQDDKWKTLPEFSAFCETNGNLSSYDRDIQEKKSRLYSHLHSNNREYILMFGLTNCCFLSLYSEQQTASCVASYLLSDNCNTAPPLQENYSSNIHDRTINLNRFQMFLSTSTRCTSRNIILNSIHVAPYLTVINKIESGCDMSSDFPSTILVYFAIII